MGLHEDIRGACREAHASVTAAADTGAEWAIEQLPRDVAGLVDVLMRDDKFIGALEKRRIKIRREPIQVRRHA